jgi:hypothetical protein
MKDGVSQGTELITTIIAGVALTAMYVVIARVGNSTFRTGR